jgi:hypothetical protein
MQLTCALNASEVTDGVECLLVLPEAISKHELDEACHLLPRTIIVGAAPDADSEHIRAYLVHEGTNRLKYLKTLSDGRSTGSGLLPEIATYEAQDFIIGVLVCRDIENEVLRTEVLRTLTNSAAPTKILCIPADMHGDWFASTEITGYAGVFVAMSNNNKTYPVWRSKSFIANPRGVRLSTQDEYEAVRASVP